MEKKEEERNWNLRVRDKEPRFLEWNLTMRRLTRPRITSRNLFHLPSFQLVANFTSESRRPDATRPWIPAVNRSTRLIVR